MIWLLGLHALVGIFILTRAARLGRRAAHLGLIPCVATVAWLVSQMGGLLDDRPVFEELEWMPALGVDLSLKIDGFSAVMILLISGIGVLIFAYANSYFPDDGVRIGRLLGLLTLFSGAMVGVVVADNLLILYGFWELTSITSFLLIGNDHDKADARASALHALLVTGAGGLAMLAGFLMLGHQADTYQLSAILADPPTGGVVEAALVLILLGAFTKSAQYPFHAWLPGAMVAPTPVSAYLHSATMVKAGVYLVARLSPAFADPVSWWRPVVIGVGLFTMLAGGLRAMRQHDLKVLLAHGTVSQLGFMMVAFGIGTPEAMAAGAVLLLGHGAFKATNFMVVGVLDHQFGTRDLRVLPRLDRSWAWVSVAAVVGAASMGGVPLALGFIVKEAVLEAIVDARDLGGSMLGSWTVLGLVVVGSAFTAAYSLRFARGALGHDATEPIDVVPAEVRPALPFVLPGAVLVLVTLVLGVVPGWLDRLDTAAQHALLPNVADHGHIHLALWHGVGPALIASVIAMTVGLLLYLGRHRVAPILARGRVLPDAGNAYLVALRGLNWTADRVTAIAQPGSLPIYAGVILVTAAVLPIWGLTRGPAWPGWPQAVETRAHIPVVIVLLLSAVAASVVRRRFSAALFLGIAGYAMAALFVVQGAPDLALTQVAIETLTTVLFVLVLRRLPDRFGWAGGGDAPIRIASDDHATATEQAADPGTEPPDSVMTTGRRALRLSAAAAVGASVFVLALVMSGPEPETPTSEALIERSEPEGHGRNVVNVTLVDFRGFDTLGEITVLASAAIGTVALARAGRRPTHQNFDPHAPQDRAAPALRVARLITLEVSVRVMFAVVMVGSIYLLFAGHNQPGGGFVGGILAGAAVALRYLAGGIGAVRSLSRGQPWTVLGVGLLLAGGTALVPVLLGEPVLANGLLEMTVPVLGKVKTTSAAVFDLGVYLAVLGLALMMFESFGDDPVETEPLTDPGTSPRVEADR